MPTYPRITFGIIVLNGEPFTRYCLRSIYPYAHEIIVVEGGHVDTKSVTTPDGHSIDGTLAALYRFKCEEDSQNKVQIVTREGHWPKKDELGRDRTPQSRAYADRATGDYLWQIDIDEFYKPQDMELILKMLNNDPSITAVSFKTLTFWGGIDYTTDGWPLRRGGANYHRLFKWGKGYHYVTHEPPTIYNQAGRDLRSLNWVRPEYLARYNIFMYHYSLLFPWQVKQKALLYQEEKPDSCAEILDWADENYFGLKNPYRVHNLYRMPSWLTRYNNTHPPQIKQMMNDILDDKVNVELRNNSDVDALLLTWWYPIGIIYYKCVNILDLMVNKMRQILINKIRYLKNTLSNG